MGLSMYTISSQMPSPWSKWAFGSPVTIVQVRR